MCFNYLFYIYIYIDIMLYIVCIYIYTIYYHVAIFIHVQGPWPQLPGHGAGRLGLFGDGAGEVAWPGSARGASFGKAMEIP